MTDYMTTRKELETQRAQLANKRQSWLVPWKDIGDYLLPDQGQFYGDAVSNVETAGNRRSSKIVDSTGTGCMNTLSAGMMSGLTSPSRPWFSLSDHDPDLNEFQPVKVWLSYATQTVRDIILKSNVYNVLPSKYLDLGAFGTSATAIVEDDKDVIRAYPFPVGSFYLAANERMAVDTCIRELAMTVRQIAQRFGKDHMSVALLRLLENGGEETLVNVVHTVRPNPNYNPNRLGSEYKAWSSCYYEQTGQTNEVLGESGFDEFPIVAPRWRTTGYNVYGGSLGRDLLPDVKELQVLKRRRAEAVAKMVTPPLVGPPSLNGKKVSQIPGDITYLEEASKGDGLRPLFQVNLRIDHIDKSIADTRQMLKSGFFTDLFLMLSESDHRDITAAEIHARYEEKIQALGPVLENLTNEMHTPIVDRVFAIAVKRGLLPPAPPELEGRSLKVEFISVMAQAQRAVGLSGLRQLVSSAMEISQVKPDVLDKIDMDRAIDESGTMLGVPPKVIRTDEQVAKIRADRQAQQDQASKVALMEQASKTAKNLSQTDLEGDNAASRLIQGPGARSA